MIPPRPWKVIESGHGYGVDEIVAADGREVVRCDGGMYPPNVETAEAIVRLVNAEPAIVAALRLAEDSLGDGSHPRDCACCVCVALEAVRAALAKVRP